MFSIHEHSSNINDSRRYDIEVTDTPENGEIVVFTFERKTYGQALSIIESVSQIPTQIVSRVKVL